MASQQTTQAAQQRQQATQQAEAPRPGPKFVPIHESPSLTHEEILELGKTQVQLLTVKAGRDVYQFPAYTVAKGEALVLDDAGAQRVIKNHQIFPDLSAMPENQHLVVGSNNKPKVVTTTREDLNEAWYDNGWMRWGAIALGTMVGAGAGAGGTYYAMTRDDADVPRGMAP